MDLLIYLVSMAVFVYIMFKRIMPSKRNGEKDPLKDFLEALDQDQIEVKKKPSPTIKKKKAKLLPPAPLPPQATLEQRMAGESIVSRHYQELANASPTTVIKSRPSRGQNLLGKLHSKKQMVIYTELFGKPRAYRPDVF